MRDITVLLRNGGERTKKIPEKENDYITLTYFCFGLENDHHKFNLVFFLSEQSHICYHVFTRA